MAGKDKKANFKAEEIEKIPNNKPVVYKLENTKGENIYTGIAKRGRVQERIKEHLPGGPDKIPGVKTIKIEQMPSIKDAKEKEQNIIARSKPKYNKKGK